MRKATEQIFLPDPVAPHATVKRLQAFLLGAFVDRFVALRPERKRERARAPQVAVSQRGRKVRLIVRDRERSLPNTVYAGGRRGRYLTEKADPVPLVHECSGAPPLSGGASC